MARWILAGRRNNHNLSSYPPARVSSAPTQTVEFLAPQHQARGQGLRERFLLYLVRLLISRSKSIFVCFGSLLLSIFAVQLSDVHEVGQLSNYRSWSVRTGCVWHPTVAASVKLTHASSMNMYG